jgi:tetratricopeptide (TPR) repeat protein
VKRALLVASLVALPVTPAVAQSPEPPPRPKLDANADTNDWETYYDYGVRHLQRFPERAYHAFYWASRLAPWSGDPLYAQWVAFHMRDVPRFGRYLDDDRKVLAAPDVRRADALVRIAFLRNPFVHRALEMALYDALPGSWRSDIMTRAWIAYANQRLDKATELFGRAIAEKPDKYFRFRHIRAVLFVAHNQLDSAIAELRAVLDQTRRLDEKDLVHVYESKAFYEYAIGRIYAARGARTAAREAFERALTEDLAYAPAHVGLATLAESAGDKAAALASYAQAVDITPLDGVYRYQYAVALLKAQRLAEGLEQINRAIALEPDYADAYVFKASAQEQLGQPDSARVAYRMYLHRAARNAQNHSLATRRLAALDSVPPRP